MEQVGFVRNVHDNKVEVEVQRISGCGGGCSSCASSCGDSATMTLMLENNIDAGEGDLVEIKAKTNTILKYTIIVYAVPFIMLILGIVSGINYFQSLGMENYELLGFVVGIVFLAISFIILKLIDKTIRSKEENPLEITRIINKLGEE